MSERARELADRFQQTNQEVIAFVQAASPETWARACPDEQCTVAALATHIAGGHDRILTLMLQPIAEGGPTAEFSWEQLHQINADNAHERAVCSKTDAIALLREHGGRAADYIRGLDDARLASMGPLPFGGDPLTAETVIEQILIGHPRQHLASMRAAAAEARPEASGGAPR